MEDLLRVLELACEGGEDVLLNAKDRKSVAASGASGIPVLEKALKQRLFILSLDIYLQDYDVIVATIDGIFPPSAARQVFGEQRD